MWSNFLQRLGIVHNKNWYEVDASVYAEAYQTFGGSFLMNPLVVESMSSLASIPVTYFACYQNDSLSGAIPVWRNYLAGDKRYLKKINKRRIFDVGNAEVILPVSHDAQLSLNVKGQFISEINKKTITNLKEQTETLSLARSFSKGDFSRKFRYNRRREIKKFQQNGGEIIPFSELSIKEITQLYICLFEKRWGKYPKGYETLELFINSISPLLMGHYLKLNDNPVAIQLIYLSCSQSIASAEYINGGVNPEYNQYSPGSILSFLNIQLAEEKAQSNNSALRFSFGITDKDYKSNWCVAHPVYRT